MVYYPAWRGYALLFSVFCIITLPLKALSIPIKGDLLITEVMANPHQVSDTNGEWFEIFNTTSSAIDLVGLTIRDQSTTSFTVTSGTSLLIHGGAYFVFGKNADRSENGDYPTDYDYGSFTLNNGSDSIILEFAGVIIDRFDYSESSQGISAELTASGFGLTPASLTYGLGDIGTPGKAGSTGLQQVAVPEPAAIALLLPVLALLGFRKRPSTAT